jgi:competence protein ComEC
MPDHIREVYAGQPETRIYRSHTGRKKRVNTILLGTWMGVVEERDDGWLKVKTIGPDGWVREEDTRTDMGLKLFFIDVGQGDACLVEAPGVRLLIDGGPMRNTRSYLTGWKYKWLLAAGYRVKFNALFVTHFDADHFAGLTKLIEDTRFEFDAIYHNGIARFHATKNKRPAGLDTDLGKTNRLNHPDEKRETLLTSFDDLQDAEQLLAQGGLMSAFRKFLEAVVLAHQQRRLGQLKRLTNREGHVPGFGTGNSLKIDVLGPVPTSPTGPCQFQWFNDSSHTRNGHSIVLKFSYGNRTALVGGDLNSESERYLLAHYHPDNPFAADATKACHHGSSEFDVDFLKAIQPYATIISSGDNENYSHPRADALGGAGRYSRGERPLVFSTELARSYRSADDIH